LAAESLANTTTNPEPCRRILEERRQRMFLRYAVVLPGARARCAALAAGRCAGHENVKSAAEQKRKRGEVGRKIVLSSGCVILGKRTRSDLHMVVSWSYKSFVNTCGYTERKGYRHKLVSATLTRICVHFNSAEYTCCRYISVQYGFA
jgi:hypothetical protein